MTSALRPAGTPEQLARWERQKAAYQALSNIDAKRTVALVELLLPIAKRVAALPGWDKELEQLALTQAITRAEEYLLIHHLWSSLKVHHEGKGRVVELAGTIAKRIGRQPSADINWMENGLYLLSDALP